MFANEKKIGSEQWLSGTHASDGSRGTRALNAISLMAETGQADNVDNVDNIGNIVCQRQCHLLLLSESGLSLYLKEWLIIWYDMTYNNVLNTSHDSRPNHTYQCCL